MKQISDCVSPCYGHNLDWYQSDIKQSAVIKSYGIIKLSDIFIVAQVIFCVFYIQRKIFRLVFIYGHIKYQRLTFAALLTHWVHSIIIGWLQQDYVHVLMLTLKVNWQTFKWICNINITCA